VVAAVTLAATLLWLGPVVGAVPRADIAGLVIAAALSIIDLPGFRALARHDRPGLVVAATAAVTVLLVGVLTGVAAALAVQAATALLRRARHQGRRSGGPTA
jgi:SulP family sulfate permease